MLFIIKIVLGDIGIFAGDPYHLVVLQKLSGSGRSADAHPAFAVTKIEHLIDAPVFLHDCVFANHADVRSAILHIGRHIRSF